MLKLARRALLAGATAFAFATPALAQDQCKELNFYNWDTYIGPDTIKNFEAATGIKVNYDLYADNDELFAKLKNGNPGYDLIVPSNDFVERMIQADMLVELDKEKIANLSNIEQEFFEVGFDPDRKFSLPYMWGTIGLGYRKSAFPDGIPTWKALFTDEKYKGRVAVLQDATTMLQVALLALGKDINDWSDENLQAAEKFWLDNKGQIAAFAGDNGQDLLLSGEVDIAIEYNGDILQVQEEDDDIGYTVPSEGTIRWEDALAIPKGAPCPENALKMIDFLLDAKEGQAIAAEIYYATPNKAAKEGMDAEYLGNPAVFPPEGAKTTTAVFPGQENVQKIDAAWTRIKAQ